MSAVAGAESLASDAVPVHETPAGLSSSEMQAAEQKRWMTWFGIPAVAMSVFVALSLGTGEAWWLGLGIGALLVDIFVLVWLCMSSDTNGLLGEAPSHH